MGRGFKETSHLNTDTGKYSEGWDRIFGNKKEEIKVKNDQERIREVVEYCYEHLDKMWAANIVGVLLDCDFRDSNEEARHFLGYGE